ncbi:MAG: hypothetical protein M3N98_03755 [Actinomycetota bacterium]|nr:hypothetical protein [Actinomycetota bacterium]
MSDAQETAPPIGKCNDETPGSKGTLVEGKRPCILPQVRLVFLGGYVPLNYDQLAVHLAVSDLGTRHL